MDHPANKIYVEPDVSKIIKREGNGSTPRRGLHVVTVDIKKAQFEGGFLLEDHGVPKSFLLGTYPRFRDLQDGIGSMAKDELALITCHACGDAQRELPEEALDLNKVIPTVVIFEVELLKFEKKLIIDAAEEELWADEHFIEPAPEKQEVAEYTDPKSPRPYDDPNYCMQRQAENAYGRVDKESSTHQEGHGLAGVETKIFNGAAMLYPSWAAETRVDLSEEGVVKFKQDTDSHLTEDMRKRPEQLMAPWRKPELADEEPIKSSTKKFKEAPVPKEPELESLLSAVHLSSNVTPRAHMTAEGASIVRARPSEEEDFDVIEGDEKESKSTRRARRYNVWTS